ncbi:MAG: HAD family hydrolase [Granulosicoccus sp.]
MNKVPLLIFDCDGVLVDSELVSLGLLIDHCADNGLLIDLNQACDCFLGKPVADAGAEASRMFKRPIPDVDLEIFQEAILDKFGTSLHPLDGIERALRLLVNPKCVASSSNLHRIKVSVDLTNLSSFFGEYYFSTDMVSKGKPHPDVFLYACEKMGYEPADALVIEDSPAGLQAAKAAGIKTIAFTGGSHAPHANLRKKLQKHSPDILIDHMWDLGFAIEQLSL